MSYKRVVVTEYGAPEVLKVIEEKELPVPQENEVRVKALAVSASFTDTLLRKGIYPGIKTKPPFSPGYDIIGIVDACGTNADSFKPGDQVAALTVYGSYSEYICIKEDELQKTPDGLDPAEAVSLILTYMTAYQMLHRSAKIKEKNSILIHGAGGAVGTALIQLGRLMDLKMYGTARKPKHKLIKELGAEPIDYTSVDFAERVKAITFSGVRAVFDPIGGKHLKKSLSCLKLGGKLVAFGAHNWAVGKGSLSSVIRGMMMLKMWNYIPNGKKSEFYSITSMKKKHPDWFKEDLSILFNFLKEGKIKPVIAKRMLLEEAAEAHKLLDSSSVEGKIVIIINKE